MDGKGTNSNCNILLFPAIVLTKDLIVDRHDFRLLWARSNPKLVHISNSTKYRSDQWRGIRDKGPSIKDVRSKSQKIDLPCQQNGRIASAHPSLSVGTHHNFRKIFLSCLQQKVQTFASAPFPLDR